LAHTIRSESIPGGHVVAVQGEADLTAAAALDNCIAEAVRTIPADGRERIIIIDLAEATFLDSRIVGVLVGRARELEGSGWRLPIVGADPHLMRLFRQMGLDRSLEFLPTRSAALAGPPA
jgi:anti-anti-sigma factor